MSKYTTEVRFLCEMYAGAEHGDYDDIDDIITKSIDTIFNDQWTTYDENYKPTLCHKILSRYYFNEIGFETAGQWKHMLNQRMVEIMPYYNELYKTLDLDYMTFDDVNYFVDHAGESATEQGASEQENTENDVAETVTRAQDTTTTVDQERTVDTDETKTTDTDETKTDATDATKWDYYSDTPQGGITGLSSNTYLTNARKNTDDIDEKIIDAIDTTVKDAIDTAEELNSTTKVDDDETTNTTRDNDTARTKTAELDAQSTDSYLNHVYGKYNSSKSYAQVLQEIREAIINIDQMIMDELVDLFMLVW